MPKIEKLTRNDNSTIAIKINFVIILNIEQV